MCLKSQFFILALSPRRSGQGIVILFSLRENPLCALWATFGMTREGYNKKGWQDGIAFKP